MKLKAPHILTIFLIVLASCALWITRAERSPAGAEAAPPAVPEGQDDARRAVPDAQSRWYSADHTKYARMIDDPASGNSQIEVSTAGAEQEGLILELPSAAKSVMSVDFMGTDTVGVLCHINPDTGAYLVFDGNSGELLESCYGYGFTSDGDTLYYVQAPQHFSGVTGFNRILTGAGALLYESEENVLILSGLEIDGDEITFCEEDLLTGETGRKTCSTSNVIRMDGSYYG